MLDHPTLKRLGVTPAKLALIGVLAIVLIGVIALPCFSRQDIQATQPTESGSTRATRTSAKAPRGATGATNHTDLTATDQSAAWPLLHPDDVKKHNPFMLPKRLRPLAVAGADNSDNSIDSDSLQILRNLSNSEGGIVLLTGNEPIARIGATTIRLGDKIGRYRVSKIDAQGVWLVDE